MEKKAKKMTPEQRKSRRDDAYYTPSVVQGNAMISAVPDSAKAKLFNAAAKVQDAESFKNYFALVLGMDNREDYFNQYAELTREEQYSFVKALANRDILDKTKGSRRGKDDKVHVDQKGYEDAIVEEADKQFGLWRNTAYQKDWSKVESLSLSRRDQPTPEVYQRAVWSILSRQQADNEDKVTASKRESMVDVKLIRRAFKFLGEVRREADKQAGNGEAMDKKSTIAMRLQASRIKDMESFEDFIEHMQEVNEEGSTAFKELDKEEKLLFVLGLCNPEAIFTENLLFRGYSKEARAKRDELKRLYSQLGEIYTQDEEGNYKSAGGSNMPSLDGLPPEMQAQIKRMQIKPEDFGKAAMALLIEKGGLMDKHKVGYNQRMIHLAVRFAKAAQMARIEELEYKHNNFKRPDANKPEAEKSNLEKLVASRADDVSTSHKLTARATMIHYERAKFRIEAERVKDVKSLEKFMEKAAPGAEEVSRFKALSDENRKILATIGLARRSIINRKADRSRVRPIQAIADKAKAGRKFDNMAGRAALLDLMHKQIRSGDTPLGENERLSVDEHTAKAAALNLLGKETQGVMSYKSNIDLGLITRALELVQEEEDMKRAEEERARTDQGGANSLMRKLWAVRKDRRAMQKAGTIADQLNTARAYNNVSPNMAKRVVALDKNAFITDLNGYDSSRIAKRESLEEADNVSNMDTFTAFLVRVLAEDGQIKLAHRYDKLSERDKIFMVKALAHRGVLDRDKDKGAGKAVGHGLALGLSFGLAHLKTGHAYEDRKGREELKKSYSEQSNDKSAVLAKEEYSLAAHALLSEKTRNAVGASTKLKMNNRRSQIDTALLERAFDLLEVMSKKREESLRKVHEKALDGLYINGEKKPEITNRTTTEQLELLAEAKTPETFFEFLKSLGSVGYAKRYSQLTLEEKKRFIYALSHRNILDKSHINGSRGNIKDERGRNEAILNYASKEAFPDPTYLDYMRAAYELVSSRTRASGKHRIAGRKSGALDEGLMDRAFLFVQETNRKREMVLDVERRKEMGESAKDIDLSEKVSSEYKVAAMAVKDMSSFKQFLTKVTGTAGKEKYDYLFNAFEEPEQELFVLALRHSDECDQVAAFLKKGEIGKGNVTGRLLTALAKHSLGEWSVGELKDEDYRNAALAMLQTKLTHKRFDSEPFKKANKLVQAAVQYLYGQIGWDATKTMDAIEKHTGGTGYEETQFSREGKFAHSNALGRRAVGFGARTKRSISGAAQKGAVYEQQVKSYTARGELKGVGKKLKRFGQRRVAGLAGSFSDEKVKGESAMRTEAMSFQRNLTGGGEATMEKFQELLTEYARKEKNLAAALSFKNFTPEEKALFIKALGDRRMLDLSREATMGKGEEEAERHYKNTKDRNKLLDDAISGSVSAEAEDIAKAGEALFSSDTLHEGKYSKEFDQKQLRSTFVDWKLVGRALELVYLAREEKKHLAQMTSDEEKYGALNEEKKAEIREKIRGTFRGTFQEEKGPLYNITQLMEENQGLIDMGEILADSVSLGSSANSAHKNPDAETEESTMSKVSSAMGQAFTLKGGVDSLLESGGGSDFMSKLVSLTGDTLEFIQTTGIDLKDLYEIVRVVSSSIDLANNVGTYSGNKADMREFLLANMPERAQGQDKDNIALKTLENAFGAVKEQSSIGISESVFELVTHLVNSAGTVAKLIGIPAPLVDAITKGIALVLKVGSKISKYIINQIQGDVVDRFFDTKELTRKYNQRVRAQNMFRADKSKKVQDLSVEEVKQMTMSKLGFRHLTDCKRFVCKSIASGVVYSYHSPNVPSNQRMAARSTATSLQAIAPDGQLDHRELVKKLMGD